MQVKLSNHLESIEEISKEMGHMLCTFKELSYSETYFFHS